MRQQPDDHLQGALRADADEHVGAGAELLQVMGELVGATIEFSVGQLLVLEDHGDGIRSFVDLRFEQLVDALLVWVLDLGVVPLDD